MSNRNFFPLSKHSLIIIHRKHEALSPWEDYEFRANLRNLRLWQHASYISEQALIIFPYLRHERLTIYYTDFMHKVHEDLLQLFINLIGFTLDKILNFIILRHCCWVFFGKNVERNEPQKYRNFYCAVPFAPHLGNVVPFFLGCFECFPHTLKGIFYTLFCRLRKILYSHLCRHILLLFWHLATFAFAIRKILWYGSFTKFSYHITL